VAVDEAESAIKTPEVAETADRHRSEGLPSKGDDTHRQVVMPIRATSVDDENNDGAKRVQSIDLVARSGEQLGSGPQESLSSLSVSIDPVEVTSPLADDSAHPSDSAKQPASVMAQLVSTVVNAIFEPAASADGTPQTPVATPTLWTLLAYTRREFDRTVSGFTSMATMSPTMTTSQTGNALQPELNADVATEAVTVQGVQDSENLYTGQPSVLHEIVAFAKNILDTILAPFGGVLAADALRIPFITDGVPPFFFTWGWV
jgi:hypothetical protein